MLCLQEEPRSDSYRHAVQPKTASVAPPKRKSKTKKDKKLELEELKQEVDMVSSLYQICIILCLHDISFLYHLVPT